MRLTRLVAFGMVALASGCQQPSQVDVGGADAPPAAAKAPVAGSGVRLEPQPGLWRTALEGADASLPDTCAKPEDIEAVRQAQAASKGGRACNPDNAFRREGEAWVARTTCDMPAGGRSETVMTVTGDLASRYRVEIVTTHADAPSDTSPDTRMAYSVERIGDC